MLKQIEGSLGVALSVALCRSVRIRFPLKRTLWKIWAIWCVKARLILVNSLTSKVNLLR